MLSFEEKCKRLIIGNSKLVFSYISDQNSQLLNIMGGSGVYTLGLSTYTFKIGMILRWGLFELNVEVDLWARE